MSGNSGTGGGGWLPPDEYAEVLAIVHKAIGHAPADTADTDTADDEPE